MLAEGTMLGKYRIVQMLGAGGMADVYEAEDQMLGRRVALKVLPPEFGRDPQAVARFEKEVRAAASLNHAHIVTIFEVDKADDIHFCAMRLLRGGDLRTRIDKGLSENQALEIIREIAEAFVHAHAAGFVHRDVKPENILFDEQGRAILTDFGIAKAMSSQAKMTATGVSIGTPRYISPEQARGQTVDGRADLYSLGAILYEMLTGRPPFEAEDSLAMIFKHVTEPVPRLPEPFARFQPLIDSLMAKDPAQRPESAAALLKLIDAMPRRSARPTTTSAAVPRPAAGGPVVTAEREHAERLAREEQRQRDAAAGRRAPTPVSMPVAPAAVAPPAPEPAPPPPVVPPPVAPPPPPEPPRETAPKSAPEAARSGRRSVLEQPPAAAAAASPGGGRMPIVAAAVAGVALLALLAWWLGGSSDDTEGPDETSVAIVAATPTSLAAAAPAPTATPEPPETSASPAPTADAQSDAAAAQAQADEQAKQEAARRQAAARRRLKEIERERALAAAATPAPSPSPEERMARERAACDRHVSLLFPGWTFTYADIVRYPGATRRSDGLIETPPLATDYGPSTRFLINANGCIVGTAE